MLSDLLPEDVAAKILENPRAVLATPRICQEEGGGGEVGEAWQCRKSLASLSSRFVRLSHH